MLYDTKDHRYFSFLRHDIHPLLPDTCGSVLEPWCGSGGASDHPLPA